MVLLKVGTSIYTTTQSIVSMIAKAGRLMVLLNVGTSIYTTTQSMISMIAKAGMVNGVTESGGIYLYNHPVNAFNDSKSTYGQWCY